MSGLSDVARVLHHTRLPVSIDAASTFQGCVAKHATARHSSGRTGPEPEGRSSRPGAAGAAAAGRPSLGAGTGRVVGGPERHDHRGLPGGAPGAGTAAAA